MIKVGVFVSFVILLTVTGICAGDSNSDLAQENAELKQRVERLEKDLAELKKMVMEDKKAQAAQKAKYDSETATRLHPVDLEKIYSMVQEDLDEKKPVWSDLDIQLYGYIRADAAFNSGRMADGAGGSLAKWVEKDTTNGISNEDDHHFNLTARRTRLGMKIQGPETEDGLETSGRVEIDFSGANDTESANHIRMRLAYLKLDWPESNFSILAGQDWDTFSPLYTPTINASVGWWTGNIGFRRPQIRLTKIIPCGNDSELKIDGAIARTNGINPTGYDTPGDAGEDSGFPGFQGRVGLSFPWLNDQKTVIGISGHWAEEELDETTGGRYLERDFDSWSYNFDLVQPINDWLFIKGEMFCGVNLSPYKGGIGQGINTTKLEEIGSRGGWIAACMGPWDKWKANVGLGVDDVDGSDVNTGDRTQNRSIFANLFYSFNKKTQVGFELSQWCTEYKGEGDAESIRAQTIFVYNF